MTSSTFNFYGETTASTDFKTATITFQFTPPENISGKKCKLQAMYMDWDQGGGPTPGIASRNQFVLDCSWTQLNCGMINQSDPIPSLILPYDRTPVCTFITNAPRASGPVFIYMPNGPHSVTMTVYRPTNQTITNTFNINYLYVSLNFEPM